MFVRIAGLGLCLCAGAAAAQEPPYQRFNGTWDRGGTAASAYRVPEEGPGPVTNIAPPDDPNAGWRGDYNAPILLPWASDVVREKVELDMQGITEPEPKENCMPMGVPHILQLNSLMQIAAGPDDFVLLYQRAMQARVVEVGGAHPDDLKPGYYGHSVGHWEGETFVIDTIGFNDATPIDVFGTPHTTKLHVVERYRLTDDDTLRVDILLEDEGAFTMPWRAYVEYRRTDQMYEEIVCAQNNRMPDGSMIPGPHDDTPDF